MANFSDLKKPKLSLEGLGRLHPPEVTPEQERAVDRKAEELGYPSRDPVARVAPEPADSIYQSVQRHRRTGRTHPFNTKIRPEIYRTICKLADAASNAEGRPVTLAEIVERGIAALERNQ